MFGSYTLFIKITVSVLVLSIFKVPVVDPVLLSSVSVTAVDNNNVERIGTY